MKGEGIIRANVKGGGQGANNPPASLRILPTLHKERKREKKTREEEKS